MCSYRNEQVILLFRLEILPVTTIPLRCLQCKLSHTLPPCSVLLHMYPDSCREKEGRLQTDHGECRKEQPGQGEEGSTCFTGPGQYSQSSVSLASQPPPSKNKIRDTSVCDGPGSHLLVYSITNKSRTTDCFPSQCFAKAICIS